ncbi:MAG: GNAT family N-acetyltransferase [Peptidiphaga sp.]|jgi:acetyltransferase, GNAT family protein|uniref:GNAT family N-acetyltransferase n=1 Tax=Actinomycetaceae TaxID=2049 RepID=UPI0003971D19|nr:DUF4081 domain-containing GNAT family N-acetyltransferase [Actinobaculum sp. oral taxon 183]ERH17207.1 acetyltransferase, GNAT family [Actinobaculum sp. oral taxon 183 str. F0552]RKV68490.1 MAG: GNAT family N-acetyltransferase [Actinomyces sp.]
MHWLRRYPSLRRLHGVDTAKAVALCERHPVDSVLLRVAIEQTGIGASFSLGRFDADRELTALAWEYGNILPLGFDEDGLDEVAEEFAGRRRTGSSIVGPADQVMGLWNRICKRWGPARDVRERQFSMVMDSDPDVVADPLVQPAGVGDVSLVFPASVAMYIEEVGYDPTSHGAGYAYRVARLVRSQHTFIRKAPLADGSGERVVFKADVGALAGGVAQLQGVWVAPDLRGRGIATAGVAAVVKLVRERLAPTISLYVNDYNAAAIATYTRVGFRIAGRWATVFV